MILDLLIVARKKHEIVQKQWYIQFELKVHWDFSFDLSWMV